MDGARSTVDGNSADVVVIGGGVIGLSIAWRSSQRGLKVTVVDDAFGRGASWAAAGMLAPVTEVHYGEERLLSLNLTSSAMYPEFAAELGEASGRDPGYQRSGTVIVAPDRDDHEALADLFAFQRKLGLEAEEITSAEARRLEPALGPSIRAAYFVPGDHNIDNRLLADALASACRAAGVQLAEDRVRGLIVAGGRAAGVLLESGEKLGADNVVLAAGAWSADLPGIPPEARPPIRPVKGQLLYLRGPAEPRLIGRNVRGLDVYLVPRADGRIAVGATVEEKGFDDRITSEAVYTLLRDAYELVPELRELELSETVVGFRPGTPDNAPLIGPSRLEGLTIAGGHYRNGILLTPATSAAVAAYLATGEVPSEIEAFLPTRFPARMSV